MISLAANILQNRPGVVSQRLAVDMSDPSRMTMLYKVEEGSVKEEHYGLALARVVDLPPQVLEIAERVSKTLSERKEAKMSNSKARAVAQKRKIVLSLKEHLVNAANGSMDKITLLNFMRRLQEEFVHQMSKVDEETNNDVAEETYMDEEEMMDLDERSSSL